MSSATVLLRRKIQAAVETSIPGALGFRPIAPSEVVQFGVPDLNGISDGIPRGCLTEICGPPSSGRTTLLLSLMREATHRGECCALIDANNAFNPISAAASDMILNRLLWVKCGAPHPRLTPADKALQAADWIINAGGFGVVALDLGDLEPRIAQKIPLATWYRLRRAVQSTATALVVIEQQPFAKSCASLVIGLQKTSSEWVPTRSQPHNPKLLTGTTFTADVTRSRIATAQRKPPGQVTAAFRSVAPWAG